MGDAQQRENEDFPLIEPTLSTSVKALEKHMFLVKWLIA